MLRQVQALLLGQQGLSSCKQVSEPACDSILDQLVGCCDGAPEEVIILHGEVCYAPIKLCSIEDSEEISSVIQRSVAGETCQAHIVVVGCDALSICNIWQLAVPIFGSHLLC